VLGAAGGGASSVMLAPDTVAAPDHSNVMGSPSRSLPLPLIVNDTPEGDAQAKVVEKLRKRYNSIRKSWNQTDNDELLERYLSAMTTGFDPHSDYMSPSTLDNFNITMRLELDGIGASLRGEDGYTVVHNVIPGGAADKDGRLKPEDKIVADVEKPSVQRRVAEIWLGEPSPNPPAEGSVKTRHILYAPNDDPQGAADLATDDPAWAKAEAEARATYEKLKRNQ